MRVKGFEPLQALSYESLNLARLTAPAHPHSEEWENRLTRTTSRNNQVAPILSEVASYSGTPA